MKQNIKSLYINLIKAVQSSSALQFIIGLLIFSSCSSRDSSDKSEVDIDSSKQILFDCDTMLDFTMNLVYTLDSVNLFGDKKILRDDEDAYIDSLDNVVNYKIPIIKKFKDSLALEKLKLDSNFYKWNINYEINEFDSAESCSNYYRIIDEDSLIILKELFKLENRKGSISYYRVSKPIFIEEVNRVLFELDYYCGGLCGEGLTYIFERKENEWILRQLFVRWVS